MAANTPPGPAVDASGQAVIDPTENVKYNLQVAVQRLNDLAQRDREHFKESLDRERGYNKEIRDIERECSKERVQAAKDKADLEREGHKERADLERRRLDAVREVDVGAVQTAAVAAENRAAEQSKALIAAAEAVRTTAETTRTQMTDFINSTVKPIAESVARLQEQMFRQAGEKSQVAETRESRGSGRSDLTLIVMMVSVGVAILLGVLNLVTG